MKKYIALICLICLICVLLLTACTNQNTDVESPTEDIATMENTEQSEKNTESSENLAEKEKNPINTMEKLTEVQDVISVTKQYFSRDIKGAVAYKVLYQSQNGKLAADVVLPEDYAKTGKNYTVLIYFPEIGFGIDELATNYALNKIILIRPYARGNAESEGVKDFGGEKDLADSQKLLKIFDSASFIENSRIFVAGSSEGSINALRLFSEDVEKRISGCAVVDVISNLKAFGEYRGEGISNLMSNFIGKTYEESPEEYELRSAVNFSEKLDRPILMIHFSQNHLFPVEQTDALYDLLKDSNKDCTYNKIDAFSGDFQGESLQRLLSFINKYD